SSSNNACLIPSPLLVYPYIFLYPSIRDGCNSIFLFLSIIFNASPNVAFSFPQIIAQIDSTLLIDSFILFLKSGLVLSDICSKAFFICIFTPLYLSVCIAFSILSISYSSIFFTNESSTILYAESSLSNIEFRTFLNTIPLFVLSIFTMNSTKSYTSYHSKLKNISLYALLNFKSPNSSFLSISFFQRFTHIKVVISSGCIDKYCISLLCC